MQLTTHELARLLLSQKDQPVYTCDYAGVDGELMLYPVHGSTETLVENGTVICTSDKGVPFHEFVPFNWLEEVTSTLAMEMRDAEDARLIELLKKSKSDIKEGRTYNLTEALERLGNEREIRSHVDLTPPEFASQYIYEEDDGPLTAKQIEAVHMMSTATNTPDSAFGKALM